MWVFCSICLCILSDIYAGFLDNFKKIFKLAKSEDVLGNGTNRCHSFGHCAAFSFLFLANLVTFYSLTSIFPQINLCI